MGRSFKLNDIHLILLSTAAERDNGALLPVAASIADKQEQVAKSLTQLLKQRLVEDVAAGLKEPAWREAGDDRFGLAITPAGRAAIGIDDEGAGNKGAPPSPNNISPAAPPSPRPALKSASVIALLQREQGATLAELVEATGWLPHTTRAALTGLRKKGHAIEKSKRGDTTCYRIAAAA